jgi:hypothetical protein
MTRKAHGSEKRLGVLRHTLGERWEQMEGKADRFDAILGIMVTATLVTGLAGLLAGVLAFFTAEWVGVGVCLGAAALAFGLAANAVLRK